MVPCLAEPRYRWFLPRFRSPFRHRHSTPRPRFSVAGMLTITSKGDFSRRIESMSDQVVKAEVLAVLRSMYPNTTIPEPDAFYFPRWKSDPLFRGSYSNWPSSFLRSHHTNLRATVEQRLWFGGEATSLKYFGRSGIRIP